MNSVNLLGLFAKYWQPGNVKTRLAEATGTAAAAEIYREMLMFLLNRLQTVGHHRSLVFTPDNRRKEFADACPTGWSICPQTDGGLGQRLSRFFEQKFAACEEGSLTKVVVIGSDCPLVSPELIEKAFAELETAQVVIGPSLDGGYYLIGLNHYQPEIFEGINWSSELVYSQTISRLEAGGLKYTLLDALEDVDDLSGLHNLMEILKNSELESKAKSGPLGNLFLRLSLILNGGQL